MTTKFSQFTAGGAIAAGDIVVGLRGGVNTQFTAPAIPTTPWTTLLVGQPLAASNGYFLANALPATFTLPTVSAVGQVIEVVSITPAVCTIAQNAGQHILFGTLSTTVGVAGSIATTAIGNGLTLICYQANTSWIVLGGAQGIWNVT